MILIISVGALVGGGLGYIFRNFIIIAGTSVTGVYMFIIGITFFIPDLPSLLDIYNMAKNGSFSV